MNTDANNDETVIGNVGTGHWIMSGLLVVWALFGVMAYMGTVSITPELLAEQVMQGDYSQGYADMLASTPAWHTALFAIAVFSSVLGAICLLLRKKWAVMLYGLSLVCVVISFIKTYVLDKAASVMTNGQIFIEVFVLLIAVFALWYARRCAARGLLT